MIPDEMRKKIGEIVKTSYGREELRRGMIRALQTGASGVNPNPGVDVLCQSALDLEVFGQEPDPWEENPFKWCLDMELEANANEGENDVD